jgi:hypothetical protein
MKLNAFATTFSLAWVLCSATGCAASTSEDTIAEESSDAVKATNFRGTGSAYRDIVLAGKAVSRRSVSPGASKLLGNLTTIGGNLPAEFGAATYEGVPSSVLNALSFAPRDAYALMFGVNGLSKTTAGFYATGTPTEFSPSKPLRCSVIARKSATTAFAEPNGAYGLLLTDTSIPATTRKRAANDASALLKLFDTLFTVPPTVGAPVLSSCFWSNLDDTQANALLLVNKATATIDVLVSIKQP